MNDSHLIHHVSDTALWVASFRALESERSDAVFRDPLAALLAGERGRKIAQDIPHGQVVAWVMVVRTTAIDRLVERALALGVDTVLNLGAGLDTRPYRMKLPATLRWIEADFPDMVAFKQEKLKDQQPVCSLERVSVDLSDHAERSRFLAQVAAQAKSVLVITEGVLPYLANDEVSALAADLLAFKQFQYWIQDFRRHGHRRVVPKSIQRKLKAAPFRFDVKDWFSFFEQRGWIPETVIGALDEGERVHRPFPFVFPWSLLLWALPRKIALEIGNAGGFVLLKRK